MRTQPSRALLFGLSVGVLVGVLGAAGVVSAQRRGKTKAEEAPVPESSESFELIDTPGSTFLLNTRSGQVWRIGFTEVRGERHWFGTYIPVQQPVTFEEFQQRLRTKLQER
jgi:hypothetical protein